MLIPHPAAFVQLQGLESLLRGTKWVPYPSSLQKPGAIQHFPFLYLPFPRHTGDSEQWERAWVGIVMFEHPWGAQGEFGALHCALIQDWDVSRRSRRGSPLPFCDVKPRSLQLPFLIPVGFPDS